LALRQRDLERAERLKARGTISDKGLDEARLALNQQSLAFVTRRSMVKAEAARLEQQKAAIDRLRVGVRRAERDLEQARLEAPFDGFLLDVSAHAGKRLSVNDRVARLIDSDRLEARIHLSDAQYGRLLAVDGRGVIGRDAAVTWRVGAEALTFRARIERVAGRVDPASGGVALYARIAGAGSDTPLRPGAFVSVRIADRRYDDVARLPESALQGDDSVYVVKDGRLQARQVAVVARDGTALLVRGELVSGDRVVTTRFPEIGPGALVEVR
jgi:RND family efflux transporter MFP subunit